MLHLPKMYQKLLQLWALFSWSTKVWKSKNWQKRTGNSERKVKHSDLFVSLANNKLSSFLVCFFSVEKLQQELDEHKVSECICWLWSVRASLQFCLYGTVPRNTQDLLMKIELHINKNLKLYRQTSPSPQITIMHKRVNFMLIVSNTVTANTWM